MTATENATENPGPASGAPLPELAATLTGRVVLPTDTGYAALATPWNVAVPSAPLAVVVAAGAEDVSSVLRFAAQHGLEVDVRGTGHGAAPAGDRTLLVHTGRLDELTVHPDGWARVGAGVRWAQLIEAAAPFGLAPPCGSAPGVGVVGLLTGGGIGPVARSLGVSSDYVRAFDVVTGDGTVRRASPEENPALYWGLCGGKGALGIVTAVELDLPTLPELFGGCLYFDAADATAVAHTWRRWSADLPEAASTSLAILRLPALPSVPAALAGRCTLAVRFTWVGDPSDGEAVIEPMRRVAPVLLGGVTTMPYARIGAVHADPVDPMPVYETAHLLRELPEAALDALLELAGPAADCPQVIVELRLLGGAIAQRPRRPSAVSHRSAAVSLLTIGIGVAPAVEPTMAHAAQVARAMQPWSSGGTLPNFGGAPTAASVHRCYDESTRQRLASLVEAYDPHAVLSAAHPIRAAAAAD